MSAMGSTPIDAEAKNAPTSGRLFFLDLSGGRILSANSDGSDLKTIVNEGRKLPDGLALDVAAGQVEAANRPSLGPALPTGRAGLAVAPTGARLGPARRESAAERR